MEYCRAQSNSQPEPEPEPEPQPAVPVSYAAFESNSLKTASYISDLLGLHTASRGRGVR